MKNKSFAKNAFFYMCKTLVQILFPIITLPYISRILGVEKIGQYNFATAYVSYFALIANLGIQTYAVRTGSEIRDDKKQLNAFANEIYTINVISTIAALLLLFLILLTSNILAQYIMLASILSITIPLTTIGTEWIFNIYEDFTYISIRSMIFQAASILLMILFVKKAEDVFIYAFITVMASAGANILNYKKASGYFEHRIIISSNLKKHLLPILILFFSTIASQIYLNADVTMLGILKGDYATGLYTAATKIYSLARNLMATIITIILPRFAFWNLNDKEKYLKIGKFVGRGFLSVVLPMSAGMILLGDKLIGLLCGAEYLPAQGSFKILCMAFVFSSLGSFIANMALVVNHEEKTVLIATIAGACINIIGNLIIIPKYSYTGAAFTTLLSEIVVFVIQGSRAIKYFYMDMEDVIEIVKIFLGVIVLTFSVLSTSRFECNYVLSLCISVVCGLAGYMLTEVVLNEDFWQGCFKDLHTKARRKFRYKK